VKGKKVETNRKGKGRTGITGNGREKGRNGQKEVRRKGKE